jgi:multidrug efflux pump subunit AcrA (membrane-fusion protein)
VIDGNPTTTDEPARHGIASRSRRVVGFVRALPRLAVRIALANSWISLMLVVAAVMFVAIVVVIVLPGYTSPMARIYTSKFGYGSLLRKLHRPFPVTSTRPVRRVLGRTSMGEGLVRSEPIVVSIVPMGIIKRRYVRGSDKVVKGQLLAEVDTTKAEIKVGAAQAALGTARAELERVRIGSAYVLANERPQKDTIRMETARAELEIQQKLLDIELRLQEKGYGRKASILAQQMLVTQAEATLRETKFNLGMSSQGVSQSVLIAESAVRDAELALKHRLFELSEYKIYSPADGLIERTLIHEGEYNQDPGKPGFLIASGSWFEANFDQSVYRRIHVGDRVDVRLEASPERVLPGKVILINPFVSYDLGGPETLRPIRPMGTGSPEWPATFSVRIEVNAPPDFPVLPGMTGFAGIRAEAEVLCLPREAIFAITAGKGMVYLIVGDEFQPREVTLGVIDGDYIEIREGLGADDLVIADGHQVLEPGDKIRITPNPGGIADALPGLPSDGRPGRAAPAGGSGQTVDGGPLGLQRQARR